MTRERWICMWIALTIWTAVVVKLLDRMADALEGADVVCEMRVAGDVQSESVTIGSGGTLAIEPDMALFERGCLLAFDRAAGICEVKNTTACHAHAALCRAIIEAAPLPLCNDAGEPGSGCRWKETHE